MGIGKLQPIPCPKYAERTTHTNKQKSTHKKTTQNTKKKKHSYTITTTKNKKRKIIAVTTGFSYPTTVLVQYFQQVFKEIHHDSRILKTKSKKKNTFFKIGSHLRRRHGNVPAPLRGPSSGTTAGDRTGTHATRGRSASVREKTPIHFRFCSRRDGQ